MKDFRETAEKFHKYATSTKLDLEYRDQILSSINDISSKNFSDKQKRAEIVDFIKTRHLSKSSLSADLSKTELEIESVNKKASLITEKIHKLEAQKARDEARDEAQKARDEAQKAQDEAQKAQDEAQKAQDEAQKAQDEAQDEAQKARAKAKKARDEAQKARAKAKKDLKSATLNDRSTAEKALVDAEKALVDAEKALVDAEKALVDAEKDFDQKGEILKDKRKDFNRKASDLKRKEGNLNQKARKLQVTSAASNGGEIVSGDVDKNLTDCKEELARNRDASKAENSKAEGIRKQIQTLDVEISSGQAEISDLKRDVIENKSRLDVIGRRVLERNQQLKIADSRKGFELKRREFLLASKFHQKQTQIFLYIVLLQITFLIFLSAWMFFPMDSGEKLTGSHLLLATVYKSAGRLTIIFALAWSIRYTSGIQQFHSRQSVIYIDKRLALGIIEQLLSPTTEGSATNDDAKKRTYESIINGYIDFDKEPRTIPYSNQDISFKESISILTESISTIKPIIETVARSMSSVEKK